MYTNITDHLPICCFQVYFYQTKLWKVCLKTHSYLQISHLNQLKLIDIQPKYYTVSIIAVL